MKLTGQFVENGVALRRGLRVGARHYPSQRCDLVVEANREVERVLATLVLGLIDRRLHLRERSLDRVGLLGNLRRVGLTLDSLDGAVDLRSNVADLCNGVVRFADAVADRDEQIELLLKILFSGTHAGILH